MNFDDKAAAGRQSIWIGFDPREVDAFVVARETAMRHSRFPRVRGIVLDDMRRLGLYTRPTSVIDGRLYDDISQAPMSTEFAISRFLTPHLAQRGWALFMDCDMMVRGNVQNLFDEVADKHRDKALVCVPHQHEGKVNTIKMDGQIQLFYARKNWSSFMFFNCEHPSNKKLTVEMINTLPGRDLHRFCWLQDHEIGFIPEEWNYLVGVSSQFGVDPIMNVHFTEGVPSMKGHENDMFADEWRMELNRWVRGADYDTFRAQARVIGG